jgi:hypothetical protein
MPVNSGNGTEKGNSTFIRSNHLYQVFHPAWQWIVGQIQGGSEPLSYVPFAPGHLVSFNGFNHGICFLLQRPLRSDVQCSGSKESDEIK